MCIINTNNTVSITTTEIAATQKVVPFIYLGSSINSIGSTEEDIETKIYTERGKFVTLRNILKSEHIKINIKIQIFCSNAKRILLTKKHGHQKKQLTKETKSIHQQMLILLYLRYKCGLIKSQMKHWEKTDLIVLKKTINLL
jgi:hypothetical protein